MGNSCRSAKVKQNNVASSVVAKKKPMLDAYPAPVESEDSYSTSSESSASGS